jgi:outer membrane murein-binding lipoprotein Lpp
MKKIIIILLVSLAGCSNQTTPEFDVPMGGSLPNALQAQVASLTAQVTALQKQVNTNQSQMYSNASEMFSRTDRLDSLRRARKFDTTGIDPAFGKIINIREHFNLITFP